MAMFARGQGPSSRPPLRNTQPTADAFHSQPISKLVRPHAPAAPAPAALVVAKPGKLSQQHGSPPRIIRRPASHAPSRPGQNDYVELKRGPLLGEGGFARVYAAKEALTGRSMAVKVISKDQLRSSKNKAKLFAEIKLHQSMNHPYICTFEGCFEDAANVYMQLELCEHGSLLDLLRNRKRYSEPEARLLMVQLLAACSYMHGSSVIHRDLKLGNLLFASEMVAGASFGENGLCLKVADFGLAALVKNQGERRKTICGTPNYIAPEILFDQANGHSFEVDVWSVGVILYTLLIGKPPFQTKDVKEIYKKIKDNSYTFPVPSPISAEATDLISLILNKDPAARPKLSAILQHRWFVSGPFPTYIPTTALQNLPDYSHLTQRQSERNFRDIKRRLGLDAASTAERNAMAALTKSAAMLTVVEENDEDAAMVTEPIPAATSNKTREAGKANGVGIPLDATRAAKELRIVEKEAQAAFSPASPIAELLRSARKPLYVSPRTAAANAANENENRLGVSTRAQRKAERVPVRIKGEGDVGRQMARIASGMVEEPSPRKKSARQRQISVEDDEEDEQEDEQGEGSGDGEVAAKASGDVAKDVAWTSGHQSTLDLYLGTYATLHAALEADSFSTLERLPSFDLVSAPRVFISSWVDYTHKYGTAYSLTDGSAGLYFNDSTTMVLAPDLNHFDYIANRKGTIYHRRNYTIKPKTYPTDLDRKAYLLEYFQDYMHKTLQRHVGWTFNDRQRTRQLDFLVKYYRMKNAIVFRLSNNVIQINFWDHQKLLLSDNGTVVTFINPDLTLEVFAIGDLFCEAYKMGLFQAGRKEDVTTTTRTGMKDEKKEKKRESMALMLSKLQYAREVLKSLVNRAKKTTSTNVANGK